MTATLVVPDSKLVRSLDGLVLDTVEALGNGSFRRPCEPDCDITHEHRHDEPDVAAQLLAWWGALHSSGERIEDQRAGDLAECATIKASGRGGAFPLCVVTHAWRLFVNPWSGNARIVIAAHFLACEGAQRAREEIVRVGAALWGESAKWKLSQLHVASDLVGLSLPRFARLDDVITHAKHIESHYEDKDAEWSIPDAMRVHAAHRKISGVTIGSASSRLQLCIYDKGEQLRATRREWGLAFLKERGWDGEQQVVRVECRFRARALDEFPGIKLRDVASLDTWHEWAPKLWRYATTKGVRYVVPSATKTRSRWKMRDDWKLVRAVGGATIAKRSRVAGIAQREERRRRASAAFVTSAVRLAAEDEASATAARDAMRMARETGQSASHGLVLAVLLRYGSALCDRALRVQSEDEKHLELRTRIDARRRHVLAADEVIPEDVRECEGPRLESNPFAVKRARPNETQMVDYSRLVRGEEIARAEAEREERRAAKRAASEP